MGAGAVRLFSMKAGVCRMKIGMIERIFKILTNNASDFTKFNDWLTILPLFPTA